MMAIPTEVKLGFHSTRERLNVMVQDGLTEEVLFVDGLQEVGLWLRNYSFRYKMGTKAKWCRHLTKPSLA